ncbi:MAG: FMN-binding protein [Candidatus Fermentibacteraceae bacterium]|nr:FMN-binding protein [Candidatus Fermentibacteraceae bacterium]MBN2609721.1 FMN-binding protein [Candidatus Fermentibacteraceae bacterium]
MAEMLKLGLILMLVALAAAVALGLVNSRTAPIIALQKEMEKQNAMREVAMSLSPGDSLAFDSISVEGLGNPFASVDNTLEIVRVSVPPDTSRIGYLFIAYGKGYSSTIQTMVAADLTGSVSSSAILYQQETPGLGANVAAPSKLIENYSGRSAEGILLSKDGGGIDAITGCTITSRAVTNSVREGLLAMGDAGLFRTAPVIAEEIPAHQDSCDSEEGAVVSVDGPAGEGGME